MLLQERRDAQLVIYHVTCSILHDTQVSTGRLTSKTSQTAFDPMTAQLCVVLITNVSLHVDSPHIGEELNFGMLDGLMFENDEPILKGT